MTDPTVEEEFVEKLGMARVYAERALECLYRPGAPKRSRTYLMLLERAQSILSALYVQEVNRKREKSSGPIT